MQPRCREREPLAGALEERELTPLARGLRLDLRGADGLRCRLPAVDPPQPPGAAALDLVRLLDTALAHLVLEPEAPEHPRDRRLLRAVLPRPDGAGHDQALHCPGHRDVVEP